MQANQNAASMVPNLFDPSSMFISPANALGIQQYNTGVVNDWNKANTLIRNAEATGNTELLNAIMQEQTGLRYQGQVANAQAVQGATNIFGSMLGGGMGGMMGGGGGGGGGNVAAFNSSQSALGSGAQKYGIF